MAYQDFQPGRAIAPVSKVEITVSCKNLRDRDAMSKSDPMAVLFMKEFGTSSKFAEVGRTEKIKNSLSPDFARKFQVDYRFEEVQAIRIEIYDVDSDTSALNAHDFLGRVECTLGEIVGAQGSKIHRNLQGHHGGTAGSIVLTAEEVGAKKEIVQMQWKGVKLDKKDFLGKSDPFLQIFRLEHDGSTTLAYRTETIPNSLNPIWRPFRIPVRNLCTGDNIDRTIRIECYDADADGSSHDLIGMFETTYRRLSQGAGNPQNVYELINEKKRAKKKDYKSSGQLHLGQWTVEVEHSFLDYIRGGTQLNFSVAVDFTASNGEPRDPKSLHYIHPQYPNQYMVALKSVGEIIQDYDYDKMFPALGFGAKLPPHGSLSHEFFLNFTDNPHCYGVNGILDAYRRAVTSVQLYGPTNFSPVINHVARFAANARDGSHYFVLLIITDGAITDFDETVASIINVSALPMSIIIVGVGGADFSAMKFLDADNGRLQQNGRYAQRDMVQFVAMRNYGTDSNFEQSQARLAKDVLAEVPNQLTSFMRSIGIKPRPPVQVNVPPPTAQQAPPPAPSNVDPGNPGGPGGPTAPGQHPPPPGVGAYPGGQAHQAAPHMAPTATHGYPPAAGGGYPAAPHQPNPYSGYPSQPAQYPQQQPTGYPGGQAPAPQYHQQPPPYAAAPYGQQPQGVPYGQQHPGAPQAPYGQPPGPQQPYGGSQAPPYGH